MNTQTQTPVAGNAAGVKFRENAQTAVQRTLEEIRIHVKGIATPIVLPFSKLHDAVKAEAMGYGMEVRLTRAAAIEHAKSGRAANAQERWDAINRLAEHYASGTAEWAMKGQGGGGLSSDTQDLIDAIVLAWDVDRDQAEAQVRTFTSAQRAALRADAEIKSALEIVWAQKGAGIDTKALKDSLLKKD